MSRYRSSSMIATAAPLQTIDATINDFLLYHERKGDSPSYLAELRSYLIGAADETCDLSRKATTLTATRMLRQRYIAQTRA